MRVVFVCSGNTCRSAYAEAFARAEAARRGLAVEFSSAGTEAIEGARSPDDAVAAARERGIDLTGHRARTLDGYPPAIVSLHDVEDPFGRGPAGYRYAYDAVERRVRDFLDRLETAK